MEQTGMLVGNFEFNPYRRPTGRGSSKFGPQKRLFKNTKMRHAMNFNDNYKGIITECFYLKRKFKRKFDFCFSSRNSVFLHGTLNETRAA